MGLEQIVNVSISRETAPLSKAGFGTPFVLGENAASLFGGDTVREYSSLAAAGQDGFTSGMSEYKAINKLFGQTPRPKTVKVGKMIAKVAQVDTITPTAVNSHSYIVTLTGHLNGVAFDLDYQYDADGSATVSEIVTGLKAVINADSAINGVAATGTVTVIITASTAGQPFATSINADANMALVHTTANSGCVESLNAIVLIDNDWYGLMSSYRSIDDARNIAEWTESVFKIFGVSRNDAGMKSASSTTDLAYLLKAASYFRTWVEYSGDTANYPEAALFGGVLPLDPGSETWAFKTQAGTVVDILTDTEIAALKAKNCNYYRALGGKSIVLDGKVAGGEFIDVIRLIDLIRARQQEGIFGQFVRHLKIPFTNGGISVVENECIAVLKAQQKIGGIAPDDVDENGDVVPGFSTSFPNINEVSANDRANRLLTGGTWTARIAGAIQAADINGTVTV